MNQKLISELVYKILFSDGVDYNNAENIFDENEIFRFYSESDAITFEFKENKYSEPEARSIAEDFLNRWKILIGLKYDPDEIDFEFLYSKVAPQIDNTSTSEININLHDKIKLHDEATMHISRSKFPPLPKDFSLTPDVEIMFLRYRAFMQNRENITSMGYMCLTILEASVGNRVDIANRYNIDIKVLQKLGELCSTKGNELEARKFPKNGKLKSLNNSEKKWILTLIKHLILRSGQYSFSTNTKFLKISLEELPKTT